MNIACYNNIWHGRFGHAGNAILSQIHKHVKGVEKPIRFTPLFKCASCLPNKMCKQPHHRTGKPKVRKQRSTVHEKLCQAIEKTIQKMSEDDPEGTEDTIIDGYAGQHFHMDFGFVRGSGYSIKQENKPTVTSIDGFSSYLIIVDRVTRYLWVFLTTSKSPPITIAQKILNKFKCKNPHRTVRTDQGKELGKSTSRILVICFDSCSIHQESATAFPNKENTI